MTTQVLMPKLGFSMEEGTIAEWLSSDGAEVKQGQALYSLESDKAIQEIESPASGRLRIIASPGSIYKVGDVLAEIV